MIHPDIVQEVLRLLAEDRLSQRGIARQLRISRGTVLAIAKGRRPDYEALRRRRRADLPQGPPVRCPGCGGLVQMPCLLCRVRAQKEHERSRQEFRRLWRDRKIRLPPHVAREVERWAKRNEK